MKRSVLVFPVMLSLLFTAACATTEDALGEDAELVRPEEMGRICTLAACTSGFTLRVPLTVSFEVLRTSTVSVCHNARCYTNSLATLEQPPYPETVRAIRISNPSQDDTQHTPLIELLAVRLAGSAYQLHFSYEPWASGDVHDGDVYDVTVTDEHGARIVDVHETVSYRILQPNGPECSPTCWRAMIDRT